MNKFLVAVDFWKVAQAGVKQARLEKDKKYLSNAMRAMYFWRKEAEILKQQVDTLRLTLKQSTN